MPAAKHSRWTDELKIDIGERRMGDESPSQTGLNKYFEVSGTGWSNLPNAMFYQEVLEGVIEFGSTLTQRCFLHTAKCPCTCAHKCIH